MSAKATTWMPLYIGDYLRDTAHLTTEQHGAYLLLLMACWDRGGTLPSQDDQLAAIARMSPAKWRASKPVIAAFFQEADGGLIHKRVAIELATASQITSERSAAGKAGAKARWRQTHGAANATAMANAQQNDTPSPSPSPSQKEGSVEPNGSTGAPCVAPLPSDPFDIPLWLVRAENGDWSLPLFRQGLAWIAAVEGKPPNELRSLLGRWLKLTGNDHKAVFDLLTQAQREAIAEPQAWITACLGGKNERGHKTDPYESAVHGAAAAIAGLAGASDEGQRPSDVPRERPVVPLRVGRG